MNWFSGNQDYILLEETGARIAGDRSQALDQPEGGRTRSGLLTSSAAASAGSLTAIISSFPSAALVVV